MTEFHKKSIDELGDGLRDGQWRSFDIVEHFLARIERLNPTLNAWLEVWGDEALEQARAADHELKQGRDRGPLHGLPVGIKDIIDIKGKPTTAGGVLLPKEPAAKDAPVIERLREAGAVLPGKLNLHEYAWGGTTENPHYGRVINPWKEGYSGGGSSGGSAAAVAAGMCVAALGTDTLGSVRIPASYCGVVGVKTSFGLVSNRGVYPLAWSLDTVGPLARTVRDAALVLEAIAGPDPEEPTSALMAPPVEPPDEGEGEIAALAGARIGVVRVPAGENLPGPQREVLEAVGRAAEKFEAVGAEVVELDVPELVDALTAAFTIALAEAAAIHEAHLKFHADQIGPDVRARLEMGRDLSGVAVVRARRRQVELRRLFHHLMASVDALLLPTTETAAHAFDPKLSLTTARFTAPINCLGYPSVSLPCGLSKEGLPMALQLVGERYSESALLRLAAGAEAALGFSARPEVAG